MNLQVIKTKVEQNQYPGGLKALAEAVGMTVQNLHRCVRENKIQAQDLEKIASELNVSIVEFFDEKVTQIRQAGRDYVETGTIKHDGTEYNAPVTVDSIIAAENAELKRKLIEVQEKVINLMEMQK